MILSKALTLVFVSVWAIQCLAQSLDGNILFQTTCLARARLFPVQELRSFLTPNGPIVMRGDLAWVSGTDGSTAVAGLANGDRVVVHADGSVAPVSANAQMVYEFSGGRAAFQKDRLWGAIDETGDVAISRQYSILLGFSDGWARAYINDALRYVSLDGAREIVPSAAGWSSAGAQDFHEGAALDRATNGLVGFIDERGGWLIPAQFEDAYAFHDGLAAVERNGLWGYIDKSGQIAVPFNFDHATSFDNGLAIVMKNAGIVVIDRTGAERRSVKGEKVSGLCDRQQVVLRPGVVDFSSLDNFGAGILGDTAEVVRADGTVIIGNIDVGLGITLGELIHCYIREASGSREVYVNPDGHIVWQSQVVRRWARADLDP